jgi:hypothetical protein
MNLELIEQQMEALHQGERQAFSRFASVVRRLQDNGLLLGGGAAKAGAGGRNFIDTKVVSVPQLPAPPKEESEVIVSPRRGRPRKSGRAKSKRTTAKETSEVKKPARSSASGEPKLGRRILEWIDHRVGPFTLTDLPPVLREDERKTGKALANLFQNGKMKRGTGRGEYIGNSQAVRAPEGAQVYKPTGRNTMAPQRAAIEHIASAWGAARKWTAAEMVEALRREFPHLVPTEAKMQDARVRMIDMANENLLIREGMSPHCTYRLGPKLLRVEAAPAEPALVVVRTQKESAAPLAPRANVEPPDSNSFAI